MTQAVGESKKYEVSPLELFFDLVFVFAFSQLSLHLLEHLSWRGVAETAVMLTAVFGVWSYTSFEATLLHVRPGNASWLVFAVMFLGLFMNASIGHAFDRDAWVFVVPFLTAQLGHGLVTTITAPTKLLRAHYAIMLGWIATSAPLWITGATVEPHSRLGWWAAAASIDLVGTWFAHPVPGRRLRSTNIQFDAEHMIERCRLFLIIALGEAVLTTGIALAAEPLTATIAVTGALALLSIVALWALYFAGSAGLIDRHLESTRDPIRAARLAMNGLVIVMAGLILLAVANEVVITDPVGRPSRALSLLLFGGPLLYLLSQIWYLWAITGRPSLSRLVGAAALISAGVASLTLRPAVSLALLALILLTLTAAVLRLWKRDRFDA